MWKARRRPKVEPPAAPDNVFGTVWMITFADLLSLLLAFFVLMFAMSSINQGAWKALADSLALRLNPGEPLTPAGARAPDDFPRAFQAPAMDLDYLAAVIERKGREVELLQRAALRREADRLVIALPADLLFLPGQATLTEAAQAAAGVLGDMFRGIENRLEVEGHADPAPLSGDATFASNWELSLARAIALANRLKAAGYAHEITAYGLADSRYYAAAALALPAADRDAYSRRVDLIVRDQPAREVRDE